MRRGAAAGGTFYSAKKWGGNCLPCPPFTDAPVVSLTRINRDVIFAANMYHIYIHKYSYLWAVHLKSLIWADCHNKRWGNSKNDSDDEQKRETVAVQKKGRLQSEQVNPVQNWPLRSRCIAIGFMYSD